MDFHGHKTWCRIIGKEDTGEGGFFGFFGKSTDDAARSLVSPVVHMLEQKLFLLMISATKCDFIMQEKVAIAHLAWRARIAFPLS